jgi:uncharacterized membrane protein HdeD (DUF308 family)
MAPEIMGTAEHEELRRAAELHRPIARAAAIGRKNGLSLLVFGVLSLLFSLPSFELVGLAIGAILTTTGIVEQRTSRRLAHADPTAPKILARNELVLMAGLLVYCVLKLTVLRETGEDLAAELGGRGDLLVDVEALTQSLSEVVYLTCMAVTLLYQGGMARYFLRRRTMIDAYLRESPEWARRVVELRD